MFAEKELQGRALQGTSKVGTTYAPRSTPSSGLTGPSSFRVPPPTSKRPADAGVAAPHKPSQIKSLSRFQQVHPLWLLQDTRPEFSATVALVFAICGRIAQVSGHTWLQKMGTSAPLTWKMTQQKMLLRRTAMSLVARTRRLLGASSCAEYSAHSYNNQRSFNAIIYSRLSSSSTIDEHVSSLMEVTAIIW
jgi:hypothetical protein